jgi:hypothetical protein
VTHHSNDSRERDDGHVILTDEEQRFRQSLLQAAERLDVPSSLLELRLGAGFRERLGALPAGIQWRRLERVIVGLSLGLAAAVALYWGIHRNRTRIALVPELTTPSGAAVASLRAAATTATLVVWDGEIQGAIAKGWSSKDGSDRPTSTLVVVAGAGHAGSTGLKWHTEGRDWTGFGWNWFAWFPSNAGTDISGYERLFFKIRIEGSSPADLPETSALTVDLGSSGGKDKRVTRSAKLSNHVGPELLDGKWHHLVIPLSALGIPTNPNGFDPKTAWEFRLGHWSTERRNFTVYLDDIGFDAQSVGTAVE